MKKTTMTNRRSWLTLVLAASLALTTQVPSCANGGIGGSGTVSGFGSIFVNGVEWFTDTAEFRIDGVPGTEEDLQLGMAVFFKGRLDANGSTGTVSLVSFDDDIEGPVAEIEVQSPVVKRLTVLGQSIEIREGFTLFDEQDPSLDFDSLGVGDVVEVSGYVDGTGDILASWVRRPGSFQPGTTHVELEGVVSDLAATEFKLGSVLVLTNGATNVSGLPAGFQNGDEVEVEGTALEETRVLASRIGKPEGLPQGIAEMSLEGIVSDFQGLHSFRVAGQLIDATSSAFEPASAAQLSEGTLVEVEGPLIQGVLIADEVRLELSVIEVKAPVLSLSDIDPSSNRIWLLGVEIVVDADTEMLDARDGVPGFGLEHLVAGDFLAAVGSASGTGGIRATQLMRTSAAEIDVRAPVDGVDPAVGRFDVMGVVIQVTAETEIDDAFGDSITSATFFSTVGLGQIVQIIDLVPEAPGVWSASELELEE
jgi:hypothetical protein